MRTVFKLCIVAIALLHLFLPLLPFDPAWPLFLLALAALATGLSLMAGIFRWASAVFLAAGAAALAWSGRPAVDWARAFGSMTNVIAIIVVMQLFALPLALGGYQDSMLRWVRRRFRSQSGLFVFATVLTHILASFLSFGSVPVAVALLEKTLRRSVDRFDRFTAAATSRGYALTALWAPGAINVFLALQATGCRWSDVFLPGLILSVLGVGLSWLLERGRLRASLAAGPQDPVPSATAPAGLGRGAPGWHVPLVTVAFVLAVWSMERSDFGAVYNRIILAGALVSLAWLAVLAFGDRGRRAPGLIPVVAEHWRGGLLKAGDLAPFFIAMGAFSGGLEASGLLDLARPGLAAAASALGPLALVAMPAAMVLLGLVGVHPFITIVLFGKILTGAGVDVPPQTVALLLASGGVVSYMVSPFTGIIMTIAKFADTSAVNVALRWNWLYCLIFGAASIAFAFLWESF